jgi:hypothetical protein
MMVTELSADDERLVHLYVEVFVPSFPADELVSLQFIQGGIRAGNTRVCAATDHGAVVAGAMVEWTESSGVLLLSYMAVAGSGRSQGIGGQLYRYILTEWVPTYDPCIYVAEVEHPDGHGTSAAHGDPLRRLHFYGSQGARVLVAPYYQPALRDDAERIYGMLLLVLHVHSEFSPTRNLVDGKPLRQWFTDYLEETEGGVGSDAVTTSLMAALGSDDGVRMVATDDYRDVPVAAPNR